MSANTITLDIAGILQVLPHRYPFLLVDRVLECVPHKTLLAYKLVSANEPYFQGHFPGQPVMPGVLIVEALAQAACILSQLSHSKDHGDDAPRPLYYLAGVDGARFRRPVEPGDRLDLSIEVQKVRRGMWWYHCQASVEASIAATATIMCAPGGDKS